MSIHSVSPPRIELCQCCIHTGVDGPCGKDLLAAPTVFVEPSHNASQSRVSIDCFAVASDRCPPNRLCPITYSECSLVLHLHCPPSLLASPTMGMYCLSALTLRGIITAIAATVLSYGDQHLVLHVIGLRRDLKLCVLGQSSRCHQYVRMKRQPWDAGCYSGC